VGNSGGRHWARRQAAEAQLPEQLFVRADGYELLTDCHGLIKFRRKPRSRWALQLRMSWTTGGEDHNDSHRIGDVGKDKEAVLPWDEAEAEEVQC
jgi:hypothetical protein